MIYQLKKDIFIRPLTMHDVEKEYYMKWMYDPEVTKYNSHGLFPLSTTEYVSFKDNLESKENIHWAIIDKDFGDKHIGNVSLQKINLIYRSAELAIVIGESGYWNQDIGSLSCIAVLDHGFRKLNLHRIWTGTAETNKGMNKIAEKIGMKKEAVFKDGMSLDGKYVNINQYVIFDNEWFKKRG